MLLQLYIGFLDNEYRNENECGGEVWLGCSNSRADQLLNNDKNWLQYSSLNLPECPTALALVNENYVWIGDVRGQIHSYSLVSPYFKIS